MNRNSVHASIILPEGIPSGTEALTKQSFIHSSCLNATKLGASATDAGSKFHAETVRWKKNKNKMFSSLVLAEFCLILWRGLLWFLIILGWHKVLVGYRLLTILYSIESWQEEAR